MTQKVTAKH